MKSGGSSATNRRRRLRAWLLSLGNGSRSARLLAVYLGVSLTACEALLLEAMLGLRWSAFSIVFMCLAAFTQAWLLTRPAAYGIRGIQPRSAPFEAFVCLLLVSVLVVAGGAVLIGARACVDLSGLGFPPAMGLGAPRCAALRVDAGATIIALLLLIGMTSMAVTPGSPGIADRKMAPLTLTGTCFAAIYFINVLLPAVGGGRAIFGFPQTIPAYNPIGIDFRQGVYLPAVALLSGTLRYSSAAGAFHWAYPPFAAFLGLPYLLLDQDTAYVVHVGVLLLANVGCIAVAAILSSRIEHGTLPPVWAPTSAPVVLALMIGFTWIWSYPFLFSVERGNTDIWASGLSLAAAWLVLARPKQIIWQIVLLSLAIHIKIYPVFLLAMLYLAHGKRIILPVALVNLGLLFILGPSNAVGFVRSLLEHYDFSVWVGDHSGYVFGLLAAREYHAASELVPALVLLSVAIPLMLSVMGWLALASLRDTPKMVALGFMITLPLMSVFPPLSNDYELVILPAGIVILYAGVVRTMRASGSGAGFVMLMMISMIVLFIERSYMLLPATAVLAQNKYLWVLLLQVIMLVYVLQELWIHRKRGRESAKQPSSGESSGPFHPI